MKQRCTNQDIKTYITRYRQILSRMIAEMSGAPLTESISHNFIVRMVPHHRAAIEMSLDILNYTQNAELISIARNIITEQTESIINMQNVLFSCSSVTNDCQSLARRSGEYKAISSQMFCKMRTAPVCTDNNINFIREMLPHHEGAIKMSESALNYEICEPLVPILKAIITSQSSGVRQMTELLQTLCCRSNDLF